MNWDKKAKDDFDAILAKIPVFLRPIALAKVSQRAEMNAQKANQDIVKTQDVIHAFFKETPFGFHGPMKTDMESLGIDYQQYGYPK